jgi:hypothetical protein
MPILKTLAGKHRSTVHQLTTLINRIIVACKLLVQIDLFTSAGRILGHIRSRLSKEVLLCAIDSLLASTSMTSAP